MDLWRRIRQLFSGPPVTAGSLMAAAEKGDVRQVRALLARDKASTYVRLYRRGQALLVAAQYGHAAAAEALLYEGGIPVVEEGAVTSAINRAAVGGHAAVIHLLGRDYPEQFKGPLAALALWRAARAGHADVVRALLQNGTPPDQRLSDQPTALLAAASKDSACVAELLEAGADPNEVDVAGRTALHLATITKEHRSMHLLLAAGADPSVRDFAGRTAIDLATNDMERSLLTRVPAQRPPDDEQD